MAVALLAPVSVHADEQVTVSGASAPWQYVDGGLNTNYQYGLFDDTTQLPTVVAANSSAGIPLIPGDTLKLTYVSGSWWSGSPSGGCDASGDSSYAVFTDPASCVNANSWGTFPGYWCPTDEFPFNFMNMIGVFTDANGSIVGTPYAINDASTLIVPSGATQLQLGADDNALFDNGGAVTMTISETPEPSTLALLSAGVVGLVGYGWRRRLKKRTIAFVTQATTPEEDPAILSFPSRSSEAKRQAA